MFEFIYCVQNAEVTFTKVKWSVSQKYSFLLDVKQFYLSFTELWTIFFDMQELFEIYII